MIVYFHYSMRERTTAAVFSTYNNLFQKAVFLQLSFWYLLYIYFDMSLVLAYFTFILSFTKIKNVYTAAIVLKIMSKLQTKGAYFNTTVTKRLNFSLLYVSHQGCGRKYKLNVQIKMLNNWISTTMFISEGKWDWHTSKEKWTM